MMEWSVSRRGFLLASGALTGVAVLAGTGTHPADPSSWLAGTGGSVVLHDRRVTLDPAVSARLASAGTRIITLADDPVRQWRDEAGTWLLDPRTRLLGITRWPEFLILRGLGAETRRHVRHLSPVAADGVMTWLIA